MSTQYLLHISLRITRLPLCPSAHDTWFGPPSGEVNLRTRRQLCLHTRSSMPCLKTPHMMASILALVLNFVLMQSSWPFERLLDTTDAGHIIGLKRGMNSAMSSTDWRAARFQFPTLQTKSSLNGESTTQQIIGRQQHGHSVLQVFPILVETSVI